MIGAPKDGSLIQACRQSGLELIVRWAKPLPGLLGTNYRWLTHDDKAGEVPFDKLISWEPL